MIGKIIALLILIILQPIFLLVSLLIIISDGFPVIYIQKSYGKNHKPFYMYKFRTMKQGTPTIPTEKFNDPKKYILKFGNFLRKLSLDELPQLLNIIQGDMKFIGPRPSLYNQQDLNELRTRAGLDILFPGVTGWAQVNGRDDLSIEEKVKISKGGKPFKHF